MVLSDEHIPLSVFEEDIAFAKRQLGIYRGEIFHEESQRGRSESNSPTKSSCKKNNDITGVYNTCYPIDWNSNEVKQDNEKDGKLLSAQPFLRKLMVENVPSAAAPRKGTETKLIATKRKRKKRKRCSFIGCMSGAVQGGVCIRHGAKRKRKMCTHPDCTKYAQQNDLCTRHGSQRSTS